MPVQQIQTRRCHLADHSPAIISAVDASAVDAIAVNVIAVYASVGYTSFADGSSADESAALKKSVQQMQAPLMSELHMTHRRCQHCR